MFVFSLILPTQTAYVHTGNIDFYGVGLTAYVLDRCLIIQQIFLPESINRYIALIYLISIL